MTASALSSRDRPALAAEPSNRTSVGADHRFTSTARTLAGATAVLALAEILVDRVGAAMVAYLAPSQPGLARSLELAGSGISGAVAVLVVCSAVAMGVALWKRLFLEASTLLATAVLAVVASVATVTGALGALHVAVVIGAIAVTLAPGRLGIMRAAVVCAASSIVLGQMVFLTPAIGDSALLRSGTEAGLLLAVILAAGFFALEGSDRLALIAGAVAAAVAAGLILARPDFSALLSTWALGATLSLPFVLYLGAAAASAMLVTGAISDGRQRLAASAIALMWVAGTVPTAVHHNLSALLGLFLLARVSMPRPEPAQEVTCRL